MPVLELGPVHPGAELEGVGVGDLGPVGDPGTHGREAVAGLAGHPLRGDHLEVPRADVVDDHVAPDVVERALGGDVPRLASHHEAELDLVVELSHPLGRTIGAAASTIALGNLAKRGGSLGMGLLVSSAWSM